MEKLFVQIFEKKKSIIEQVKHQVDLYDQHLASKCLIDGITPPPWLWSSAFSSQFSDANDVNKEELIAGILQPHVRPAIHYPNNHSSLHQHLVVTADNVDSRDVQRMGVDVSNIRFDEGDSLPVSTQNPLNVGGCASSSGCDPDLSVTSPERCSDAIIAENYPDQALSLLRIQRSKSRQRAFELRSSAKKCGGHQNCKSNDGASSTHIRRPEESGHIKELDLLKPICAAAKAGDSQSNGKGENIYSCRLTGCKSPDQETACHEEPSEVGKGSQVSMEDRFKPIDFMDKLMATSLHRNESFGLVNPSVESSEICGVKKTLVKDSQSKEKEGHNYSGRITRSRTSSQYPTLTTGCMSLEKSSDDGAKNALKSMGQTDHFGVSKELIRPSEIIDENSGVKAKLMDPCSKAKVRDSQSKEKERNHYSGRKRRSSSSNLNLTLEKRCMNPDTSSDDGIENAFESLRRRNQLCVSKELTRPSDVIDESSEGKANLMDSCSKVNDIDQNGANSCSKTTSDVKYIAKVGDLHNIEMAGNLHSGRVTRSRSSGQASSCNSDLSISGNSSQGIFSVNGKKHYFDESMHQNNHVDVSGKLIEPFSVTKESCGVAVKLLDCWSKETATNHHATKNTGSETTSVVKSTVDRIKISGLGASNSESTGFGVPQTDELFNMLEEGHHLVNVCHHTDDTEVIPSEKCHTMAVKADLGFGIQAKDPSINSESGLEVDHHRVDSEVLASSLSHVLAMSVKPKQLNFDETEVNGLDQISAFVFEKKKQDGSPAKKSNILVHSAKQLDECTSVDSERNLKSPEEMLMLEEFEAFGEEGKQCRGSSEVNHQWTNGVCKSGGGAPIKETSRPQVDMGMNTFEGSSQISTPNMLIDYSIGTVENSLENLQKKALVCNSSDVNATKEIDHSSRGDIGLLDAVEPTNLIPKESNCDSVAFNGHKMPMGTDLAFDEPSLLRNLGNGSTDPTKDPSVSSVETNDHFSGGRNILHLQSSENQTFRKSMQLVSRFTPTMEVSDHQHKRRKIEAEPMSIPSTSPRLRDDPTTSNIQSLQQHMIPSPMLQLTKSGIKSQGCLLKELEAVDHSCVFETVQFEDIEVILHHENEVGNTDDVTYTAKNMVENISDPEGNGEVLPNINGSLQDQSYGSVGIHKTTPASERFSLQADEEKSFIDGEHVSFLDDLVLPKTTIERASILEQLCKSACTSTPLSQFSTTYQSDPNGLLEGMDLRSTIPLIDDADKSFGDSSSGCLKMGVNHYSHGRSNSDCLPYSRVQSSWDIKKPYSSPVAKLWDRSIPKSGSSEKRRSLNPELPCICEENEITEEAGATFQDNTCLDMNTLQLSDISENANPPALVLRDSDRHSIDSVNTEFSFAGTSNRVKIKSRNQVSSRKYSNKGRENNSISVGTNGAKRGTGSSLHTRFSKPKLSEKAIMRGGLNLTETGIKRNNIVSNVTSFVQLVQQKQAAAVITGKRDVKVKSLEAAEAAKRLAEKKENERKMKKEALKLERARLEQENLRQLELQKKKKEDERKKKEGEMAERKRQRDEEERKEKERKRKRAQEVQQLRANKEERDLKRRATDGRTHEKKETKDDLRKVKKSEQESQDENLQNMSKMEYGTTKVSTSHAIEESEALRDCGDNSKETTNPWNAAKSDVLVTHTVEDSYDISPYKCSDDEDEDEDADLRNSKYVPSWASKNRIALVVSSQQSIDPEKIFPKNSFCSITEVLIPRKASLR